MGETPNASAEKNDADGNKKSRRENVGFKEASTGFEPVNDGFAIRCLSRLATTP